MRGNRNKDGKPLHIISAWSKEDSFCMGQKAVLEKSNEIKAIPLLLENIQIKGDVITIDAIGTQTTTAEKIKSKHATVQTQPTAPTERLITSATRYFSFMPFLLVTPCGDSCIADNGFAKAVERVHDVFLVRFCARHK